MGDDVELVAQGPFGDPRHHSVRHGAGQVSAGQVSAGRAGGGRDVVAGMSVVGEHDCAVPAPGSGSDPKVATVTARKLVLMMSVSVDGFFAGPDGELDWQVVSEELHRHFNSWLGTAGAFLDGRVTYELMADFWPTADAGADTAPHVAEFARIWRDIPKIVFSRTLKHAEWNATVLPDVIPDEIDKLKQQPGGDLVLGGANLAETFARLDLIDEYRIYVQPVLLGRGKPLFRDPAVTRKLHLAETVTFGGGVVLLRYLRG